MKPLSPRTAFLEILATVANNKGKTIHFIDKFYPSSKTCFDCGYHNKELTLKDRVWDCPDCGTKLDRDLNAAKNIQRAVPGWGEYFAKVDLLRAC